MIEVFQIAARFSFVSPRVQTVYAWATRAWWTFYACIVSGESKNPFLSGF